MRAMTAAAVILLATGVAHAQDKAHGGEPEAAACRRLTVFPEVSETIDANITVSAHLKFPSEVKTWHLDSSAGLWEANDKENSVWVRPKEDHPAVDHVGLTVFLKDGHQYDFTVRHAITLSGTNCVVISDPPASRDTVAERKAKAIADQDAQMIAGLNARLRDQEVRQRTLIDQMRSQIEQQAQDRIKSFQYAINTKYHWQVENGSEESRRLVDSVYDDGRFTYIRITTTAFGLPSVTTMLNGSDAVVKANYDDLTGVYTITGLFDQLRVKLGSYAITVQREG